VYDVGSFWYNLLIDKNQQLKGYLFLISSISIWAISSGILVKLITVSSFTLYGIGAFFGILFLFINLFINKKFLKLIRYPSKTTLLMLLVGLGVGLNNGFFFTALKSGSVANAVLSHNLAPFLVVFLFAPLMLKEKLTKKTVLFVLLAFLGLLILTIPSFKKSFDLALIYGGISAVFYAFHTIIQKKVMQAKADPLIAATYQNLVPFFMYAPFALGSIKTGISVNNWILLAIWGVLVLGISFTLFFSGIKRVSATNTSILTYGEPVGAIILAFIFFKQPIDIYIIIGGLLILLSGIFLIKSNS
jgi:drug/metabolite transporter (DMT)-like permease